MNKVLRPAKNKATLAEEEKAPVFIHHQAWAVGKLPVKTDVMFLFSIMAAAKCLHVSLTARDSPSQGSQFC